MILSELVILKMIIEYLKIEDVEVLSLCDKGLNTIIRNNSNSISKIILSVYEVDYNDKNNFIYIANEVEWVKERSYKEIYKLYYNFYNSKFIIYEKKGITSFPKYPKMVYCNLRGNKLKRFPIQESMISVLITCNDLESFPVQPNMVSFSGSYNNISEFSKQPKMKICFITSNKIKKLDQVVLEYLEADQEVVQHYFCENLYK